MGLKWFRARLTMNRMPKSSMITSSVSGFYRSISQFDTETQPAEPTYCQEIRTAPSGRSIATTPSETIAHNPMAGLNRQGIEGYQVPSEIISIPRQRLEMPSDARPIDTNEDLESPDDSVPKHLPRESIDFMRNLNSGGSFNRKGSRSRRVEFKKKKGRAPIPVETSNNHSRGGERFITFGKNGGSDASEIEI
ncbi:uncharacterized protein [Venturia canescens]|uniref:uncharacterized protein n=1 Tax=Venturia canescens TaxID=32260 RepID=UPI001C9D59DB|nr:uncharacterized protein LOC122405976 [Venturia canescens]